MIETVEQLEKAAGQKLRHVKVRAKVVHQCANERLSQLKSLAKGDDEASDAAAAILNTIEAVPANRLPVTLPAACVNQLIAKPGKAGGKGS